jgi:hypothetical protein
MDKNDLKKEEIHVKIDQNNLICIDPNSVVDQNGIVSPRGINPENLVMYVNLEADIIPRSNLIATNDRNTLTSIARGTLNFLKNQKGSDYDTTWTESFLPFDEKAIRDNGGNFVKSDKFEKSDTTGQSFGIDSINIEIKGINSIPQVKINFIDVRGKTLFESPENSPYKAFFHIPWPIFYLTVKGFFGKAIRYRLHMVKFSSKFNEANGNFEIQTTFVGSTYAYLSDIPLHGILNAPYMYIKETINDKTFNPNTKFFDQKVSKSSKGYSILKSVYSEYKAKGYIDQNFPVRTLRELITMAESLDKLLEKEIFDQIVSVDILSSLKEFEVDITNFEKEVIKWGRDNLNRENTQNFGNSTVVENNIYFALKNNQTTLVGVTGSTITGTLEKITTLYSEKLNKNKLLANNILNKTKSNFSKKTLNLNNKIDRIKNYYEISQSNNFVYVGLNLLVNDIRDILKSFNEQRDILENDLEIEMNKVIKDPTKQGGLGFEPTIRNIFAVILANADTYIRLLKDVHQSVIDVANERADKVRGFTDETPGEPLYPWPEIKKNSEKTKQKVIAYPAENDLKDKLNSTNPKLWPEVEFIENYIAVSTNKNDPNTIEENGVNSINFIFESDFDVSKIGSTSTFLTISDLIPYSNKTQVELLYEIWERNFNSILFESFTNEMIKSLANIEYSSLEESIKDDTDIIKFLLTNVRTSLELVNKLKSIAPIERVQYFEDQLPSTQYIRDLIETPYSIEEYTQKNISTKDNKDYDKIKNELNKLSVEKYRLKFYPFNSTNYLNYTNSTTIQENDIRSRYFNFNNYYSLNLSQGFISGPIDGNLWVKQEEFKKNIFGQKLIFDDTMVNILNSPYFHNQLISDHFSNTTSKSKYAGSAYLLLHSLPFVELENNFNYTYDDGRTINNLRVSNVFREVGSSHYIPYHLILKWGSIYHRYKKFKIEGIDILSEDTTTERNGFITTSNVVRPINTNLFFNNFNTETFPIETYSVTNSSNDVGINPYYQGVYSTVVNGYSHYDILSGATSYTGFTNTNNIIHNVRFGTVNNLKYWTVYVDNQKYQSDNSYTLLPCDGANEYFDFVDTPIIMNNADTLDRGKQIYHRALWCDNDYINNDFTGRTFSSSSEYQRTYVSGSTTDDRFEMSNNYRKVYDLIATFSPKILNEFEEMFLEFATEKTQQNVNTERFGNITLLKFQDLLKQISNIDKKPDDENLSKQQLINELKKRQLNKLEYLTQVILSNNNLIKLTIGNSKEYDAHILYGFTKLSENTKYNVGSYDTSQLNSETQNLIKLYIGEYPETSFTINLYENFFSINNIELNEENIITYRPLIYMYAGFVKSMGTGYTPNNVEFVEHVKNNIFNKNYQDLPANSRGFNEKVDLFFNTFIDNFKKLRVILNTTQDLITVSGYNNDPLKLELYNFFKSFNDKWVAGNSIGQRTLIEEFLFLDKANRDIGNKFYLNLDRLIQLDDEKNRKQSLYGVLSILLNNTGFDMRPLPSYINFYGTNFSNKTKFSPSKNIAENVFGTFLDVDYQESSPKIIIQYLSSASKRPDMSNNKFNFTDDSFNISNISNNPLLITTPAAFNTPELSKSNKVVAFEINFGDQNQGIFKSIQLDQQSIKNTSESFAILENLGRTESGSSAYNVDVALFEYYRTASYQCQVTCMGNVMIQPTMFFYLGNIPMFKGSYWITEVMHNIKNNNIVTSFKGTRIPMSNLPDPKDSFISSYRVLFDRLVRKAQSKVQQEDRSNFVLTQTIQINGNSYTVDIVTNKIRNEKFVNAASLTEYGIPYNGYNNERYIQMVEHTVGNEVQRDWLRAVVVMMGGPNYGILPDTHMALIDKLSEKPPFSIIKPKNLQWKEMQNSQQMFYSTKFSLGGIITANNILQKNTLFYNPEKNISFKLEPNFQLNEDLGGRLFQGPVDIGAPGKYGIAMSKKLMEQLNLNDGDVVYFKLV